VPPASQTRASFLLARVRIHLAVSGSHACWAFEFAAQEQKKTKQGVFFGIVFVMSAGGSTLGGMSALLNKETEKEESLEVAAANPDVDEIRKICNK
jgi:hypothetical protein